MSEDLILKNVLATTKAINNAYYTGLEAADAKLKARVKKLEDVCRSVLPALRLHNMDAGANAIEDVLNEE